MQGSGGALYHVIVRGKPPHDIFSRPKRRLPSTRRELRERYRCIVYAYVLMSNHVHLLIETDAVGYQKIMQAIQFSYTQRYNVGGDACVIFLDV
jgi:putative transposase